MTPDQVHHGQTDAVHAARQVTLDRAYRENPERFVKKAPTPPDKPTAAWINPPAPKSRARIMAPGFFDVIEPSRAFLRSGFATGINSLRRPSLSAAWAASTAIRYVTPRGPTHDGGSMLKRPEPGRRANPLAQTKASQSTLSYQA